MNLPRITGSFTCRPVAATQFKPCKVFFLSSQMKNPQSNVGTNIISEYTNNKAVFHLTGTCGKHEMSSN